ADCLSQSDRVAPIHALDRAAARSGRPAPHVRLAGHARRGAVRVLVTGATGFTGGHLARTLAARGYEVRALARRPELAHDLEKNGIEIVEGDVRDRAALSKAVAGV